MRHIPSFQLEFFYIVKIPTKYFYKIFILVMSLLSVECFLVLCLKKY